MNAAKPKSEDLDDLFHQLDADLDANEKAAQEILSILSKVKVYGRNPVGSEPIHSRHGIEVLGKYAFTKSIDTPNDVEISREALRCLANALLLNENARQIFVDLKWPEEAASRLKVSFGSAWDSSAINLACSGK